MSEFLLCFASRPTRAGAAVSHRIDHHFTGAAVLRPIGSPTSVDFLFLEEISGDDLRTTFATSFVTVGTLFLFGVDAHARRAYAPPCARPAAAKTKWRMRRRRHSRVFGTEFETPVRCARDRLRFLHRVCAP